MRRHNIFSIILYFIISWLLASTLNSEVVSPNPSSTPIASKTISFSEDYAWPVVGIRAVTGTFGEYRSTHFHMGMDFSTGGRRGLPIVSVSKGKIVKIQRYWYSIGNAVIVEHADGKQARYGHLSRFSPKIVKELKKSSVAKTFQSRRDFTYEMENPIDVEKGEIIAYSGDTGIGPPHLHFELFKDGIYYNPRDYGIGREDGEEVIFKHITFKPESSRSFINGKHESLTVKLVKEESSYKVDSEVGEITIQGLVSIQIDGHQKSNNSRLGLQHISMVLNGNKLLDINFRELPKSQTKKFVLVYDAYKSKTNGDPFLYNLFTREGNSIPGLGNTMQGSGLISSGSLNLNALNELVIMGGGLGNQYSEIYINPIRDTADYSHIETPIYVYNVKRTEYTSLSSSDKTLELFFPANSVYTMGKFEINEIPNRELNIPGLTLESKIYQITPEEFREFNLGYDLYVKLGYKTDVSKVGLFEIFPDGKVQPVKGASLSSWGKFFKVRMKRTGTFAVLKDEIAPTLELVGGYLDGHKFANSNFEIMWKLEDEGSGFDQNGVQVTVDGEPAVGEFNHRKNIVTIVEPENIFQPGKHKLEITVFDRVGNRSDTKVFNYEVGGGRVASAKN
ncbi:MAG: peptidoglycan DD-metalloendopeptidase family protein [Leptospira sp.]|nr:peptidoglycan DD-metalloendopeptidase family protein [Leptospira sp.]